MSEQSIDRAASAAAGEAADPGDGQGLASPAIHAGGTVPGGGPDTGDAPMTKDFQQPGGSPVDPDGVEDAVTADTEGAALLQRQAAMDPGTG